MKRASYSDGTRARPVKCDDWSEACDTAVERDRPVYVVVCGLLGKVFPSREYRILGFAPTTRALCIDCGQERADLIREGRTAGFCAPCGAAFSKWEAEQELGARTARAIDCDADPIDADAGNPFRQAQGGA